MLDAASVRFGVLSEGDILAILFVPVIARLSSNCRLKTLKTLNYKKKYAFVTIASVLNLKWVKFQENVFFAISRQLSGHLHRHL